MTPVLRPRASRAWIRAAALAIVLALVLVPSALGATGNFNGTVTAGNPPQSWPISVSMPGQISASLS